MALGQKLFWLWWIMVGKMQCLLLKLRIWYNNNNYSNIRKRVTFVTHNISWQPWAIKIKPGFIIRCTFSVTGLQITVGHCTLADQNLLMSNDIFCKSEDGVPQEQHTNSVYSITCKDLEHVDTKQTKCQFGTHFKDHQKVCLANLDHTTGWNKL